MKMSKDTLAFLIECLDPDEGTVITDSKLVNERLISTHLGNRCQPLKSE